MDKLMKYLYIWKNLKLKTMKKLLLLLMIVPMIGFGQRDTSDLQSCNDLKHDAEWREDISPVQLIDLLACAARHKDSESLEIVLDYQYFEVDDGCEHLSEFNGFLNKVPTSNRDIKKFNKYISNWSNIRADYVSPVIPFGGKEYIKVSIYNETLDEYGIPIGEIKGGILFTNGERGSNYWVMIIHPERLQKAIHRFFKKEKNWHFDKYPKK
jgi:hypothetical protein